MWVKPGTSMNHRSCLPATAHEFCTGAGDAPLLSSLASQAPGKALHSRAQTGEAVDPVWWGN